MLARIAALLVCIAPLSPAFCDDALTIGNTLSLQGDIESAVAQWSKSTNPEAAFNIGMAAMDGSVENCDNSCSLAWLQKAAEADYIPALTPIAALFINDGQREKGIAILQHAVRWNNETARNLLAQMGESMPPPDLYLSRIEEESQERVRVETARQQQQLESEIRRLEQQQAAAAYAPALSNLITCLVSRAACAQQARALNPPPSAPAPPVQTYVPRPRPTYQPLPSRPRTLLCPNGQYVFGDRCHMAPDGSYHGDKPQMAADGTYVGGKPQMAPDGSYVGGSGRLQFCADGSYVIGSRCKMMPDGTYAGEN